MEEHYQNWYSRNRM